MAATRTGPLTHGQLSQLRDTESQPPEGRHQANVWRVMPLDFPVSAAALRRASTRLRARHDALRTTYDLSDPARLRQVVHPAGDSEVEIPEIPVPPGEDPAGFADRLAHEMQREAFDLATEEPSRAAIVLAGGRPAYLVTIVHHIAADLWSESLMAQDFHELLAGREPRTPVDSPLDLALAQHSARGLAEQAETEQYLRQVYTAVAAAPGPEVVASPKVLVNTLLDSRIAVAEMPRAAAALRRHCPGFSVPSLVLAAYCYTAHRTMGVPDLMVSALTNNRLHPGAARMVGNMVQWARILSHYDGQPFDEFALELHEASMLGYRHGCYDVDADDRIRREVESTFSPIRFEINFNYAQGSPDALPGDVLDWRVREVPAPYYGGPGFYLVAYHGPTHLELTGRTRWEGFDHATMETLLTDLHDLLLPSS